MTVVFVTHSVFESVYLSSRIVVMAPRARAGCRRDRVDAPYPRDERFRTSAEYAGAAGAPRMRWRRAMGRSVSGASPRARAGTPRARAADRAADRRARARHPAWDLAVRINDIPPYVLPGPGLVLRDPDHRLGALRPRLLVTLRITFLALLLAAVGGVALAVLFAQSRLIEFSLFPMRSCCR